MKDNSDESTESTPWPFIGALVIIVLVIGYIGWATLLDKDEVPEVDVVAQAAIGQNDALQRADYTDFRAFTCAEHAGEEADVLSRQQDSVNQRGARYVDGVSGVAIDGDRATGTVIYHFDNTPDDSVDTATSFLREDGVWKVCSPGP
ncbi:MAG: lumazine-binding protein [Mycobacterium sp.]